MNNRNMKLLAYDLGASNGRAILGRLSGGRIDIKEIRRFPNNPVWTPTHLYWDTFGLLHELQQALIDCNNETGALPDSIGINAWGVGLGLIDEDGDLVFSPVHYRDVSRNEIVSEMEKHISLEQIFYKTGYNMISSIESVYHLFEKKPKIIKAANSILFTPDLLGFFMCGNRYAERSICSTSKLLDNETGEWSLEIMSALGIDPDYFPDVIEPGTLAGKILPAILEEIGLKGSVNVVAVAGHDTASAAAAVPAVEDEFAYISCGTWSVVGTPAPKAIRSKEVFRNNGSYDCSVNGGTDMRINMTGLWIVQEIKRRLSLIGQDFSYPELNQLAADAAPFISVIDPDAEIFFHPGNMDENVRQFCRESGQRVPESVGEVCRVVLESLALKYRYTVDRMERMLSKKLPVVYMIGGGTQNEPLCRFTASACQRPVKAGPVEATVLGNLLMQAKAMGAVKSVDEGRGLIRASCEVKNYSPQDSGMWERQYDIAKSIFK